MELLSTTPGVYRAGWDSANVVNVENDDLTQSDMSLVVSSVLDQMGSVTHNLDSFNNLMSANGIPYITTKLFGVDYRDSNRRDQTEDDRRRKSVRIQFSFTGANVGMPQHAPTLTNTHEDLYPNKARVNGTTYKAPLEVGGEVTLTAVYLDGHEVKKSASVPPIKIADFPIMVKSDRCHTSSCSREALKNLEEDPKDIGGYFIIGGQEYVIDLLENIRYNMLHIHRKMEVNEMVRGEFLSQQGGSYEHSMQTRVRHMVNGAITIEINSTKFQKVKLPFYLLYRLFGMASDEAAVETIVFDVNGTDSITDYIKQNLEKAFLFKDDKDRFYTLRDTTQQADIIRSMSELMVRYLSDRRSARASENTINYLLETLMTTLDQSILPHLGDKPENRMEKLRFLGLMIYKMFLVELGVLMPTDRDNYASKRVHGAGASLAKSYKTRFNKFISTPALKAFRRLVRNNSFDEISDKMIIDTFKSALITSELDRELERAITAGQQATKTAKQTHLNRVSSQIIERKNYLHFMSTLRTVTTHNPKGASKQTERADVMRRVQPSYVGYICITRSVDTGERIGTHKELAISATVCEAIDAVPLKTMLLNDPEVIALSMTTSLQLARGKFANIFVNGQWIGVTKNAPIFTERYRLLRREGKLVSRKTSIVWDPVVNEVGFLLDVGRLVRPLLIVDNNLTAYNAACRAAFKDKTKKKIEFTQNIRLTKQHIMGLKTGRLAINQLIEEGVMEYITPEEQENCYLANCFETLREHKHDVCTRFTHCDVEESIFGITSLMSPYGDHTQPARVCFETNQARQTCGWYSFAAPYRVDKNRFFQWYNETPLVKTIAQKYTFSNGMNCMVAYMSYYGYGQEDSIIFNKASVERGMFAGSFYRNERVVLERGEHFGLPSAAVTKGRKPRASYEKLVDGFVRPGTVVQKGDIIIGRYAELRTSETKTRSEVQYRYIDRSIEYQHREPAIVDRVWKPRGSADEQIGIVKLRSTRPLGVGDKLSSRQGNKGINAQMYPEADLPVLENGTRPDIIINMASIPTRLTVGQMLETSMAKVCAHRGSVTDATSFKRFNYDEVVKQLEADGFRYNGKEVVFNGITGDYMDAAIFFGPTFYQRLQKFATDDIYAIASTGPTDTITGQPLEGKNVRGGLKIGEMEVWTLNTHGAGINMIEKMSNDSDGRQIPMCRTCGNVAIIHRQTNRFRCTFCNEGADLVLIDSSRSSSAFCQELRSANVVMEAGMRPRCFEQRE